MKEACEKLGEIVLVVHLYFHTHESLLDGSQIHLFGVLLPQFCYIIHILEKLSHSNFNFLVANSFPKFQSKTWEDLNINWKLSYST